MTEVESMVEPYDILNDLGRETVAFVHFRLSHAQDSGRLGVNLSVPSILIKFESHVFEFGFFEKSIVS
jgi:hypothetical protein